MLEAVDRPDDMVVDRLDDMAVDQLDDVTVDRSVMRTTTWQHLITPLGRL